MMQNNTLIDNRVKKVKDSERDRDSERDGGEGER